MSRHEVQHGSVTPGRNDGPDPSHQRITTVQKAGISAVVVALLGLAAALVNFASDHVGPPPGPATTTATTSGPGAASASLYLSTDAVPYGGTFTVSGEGFAPNQKVKIRISTFDVATPTANAQGGFANVKVSIPAFFKDFQKPMTVDVYAMSDPDFSFGASRQVVIT